MKRNYFQSGDIFIYPEGDKGFFILARLRKSYIAVDLRYGMVWDNPTMNINDAVKDLQLYKLRDDVKITVE